MHDCHDLIDPEPVRRKCRRRAGHVQPPYPYPYPPGTAMRRRLVPVHRQGVGCRGPAWRRDTGARWSTVRCTSARWRPTRAGNPQRFRTLPVTRTKVAMMRRQDTWSAADRIRCKRIIFGRKPDDWADRKMVSRRWTDWVSLSFGRPAHRQQYRHSACRAVVPSGPADSPTPATHRTTAQSHLRLMTATLAV